MTTPIRPLYLAIGAWKQTQDPRALAAALLEAFGRASAHGSEPAFLPRVAVQHDVVTVDLLTATSLCRALDVAGRGRAWAMALLVNLPRAPLMIARQTLEQAEGTPWGLAIRQDRWEPSVAPVAAVLALHLSILRSRTPTMWRAIDAAQRHGSAVAAARHLDVSHQAVSRQLRAAHLRATATTPAALAAALAAARRDQPSPI